MNLDLSGKVALITGSSKGIGLAIAKSLHTEGCSIALNSRNSNDLSRAIKDLAGSIGIVGDVTSPTVAKRIVKETLGSFGRLDILVCNVGSGKSVAPGSEVNSEWRRVFSKNLLSTTNCVEAARSALALTNGTIICISSICGLETIKGAPITYSVAKAALNAYVRGISRPLSEQKIRINAIAAGNILFEGSIWEHKTINNPESVKATMVEVPLRRFGTPEDVANLALYLASSKSSFATGSIWKLDGGQLRS
jgi:NAD(P)-dependent dehydrogenase (short-subunit alcohol dehydrogenase family)